VPAPTAGHRRAFRWLYVGYAMLWGGLMTAWVSYQLPWALLGLVALPGTSGLALAWVRRAPPSSTAGGVLRWMLCHSVAGALAGTLAGSQGAGAQVGAWVVAVGWTVYATMGLVGVRMGWVEVVPQTSPTPDN